MRPTGSQHSDLVVHNKTGGTISLYPTLSDFGRSSFPMGVLPGTWQVSFTDMDADGKADLIGHELSSGILDTWLNGGCGIFSAKQFAQVK